MQHPYEIHLTVSDVGRVEFQRACADANVKPVMLELQSLTHGILGDAMTSSTLVGSFDDARNEARRISSILWERYGMPVIRYKIETVPWHPQAQAPTSDRQTAGQYFESHLSLAIPSDMTSEEFQQLVVLCASRGLHLSRNVFKRLNTHVVHMATLRSYELDAETFSARAGEAKDAIESIGIRVIKYDVEFAVWDTNSTHDTKWME